MRCTEFQEFAAEYPTLMLERATALEVSWACELCDRRGAIEVQPHSEYTALLAALRTSHAARSPDCDWYPAFINLRFAPPPDGEV